MKDLLNSYTVGYSRS